VPRKAAPKGKKLSSIEKLKTLVEASLDDDKAEDITVYDLTGHSSLTDYMIIATGKSARQVSAMAEHLREKMEGEGKNVSIEGAGQGDWVLVDAGDVIVHLFRPEVRAFYQLERLWAPESLGQHS
jgi:ribosome-associated protein